MRHQHSIRSLKIGALVICGVLTLVSRSSALHTVSPPFTQVSQQASGTVGRASSWLPRFWTFEASGDTLGTGNASPNIFLYDHALRVLGGSLAVTQITCGPVNATNPSMARYNNLIAFEANGDLCADPRNNCDAFATPTTGRQIFIWDYTTGQIQQVTNCPGNCTNPNLGGSGHMITFESDVTLIGTLGIPLPKPDIYQADLRGLGARTLCPQIPCGGAAPSVAFRRLTFTGGRNAVQNGNGRIIAFQSDGDPANNGASPGVDHVYILTRPRDPFLPITSAVLAQISDGSKPARNPTMNASGRLIAFEQDIPFGASGPMVTQIMFIKYDKKHGTRHTRQITDRPQNSYNPSIAPDGVHLSFASSGDLLNFGYPGTQAYYYNTGNGKLQQLTAGSNGSDFPQSTLGVFVGFTSTDDFLGNGNTTQQFWVANAYRGGPASFPSPRPGTATPRPTATPSITPTPFAGIAANIGLALLADEAADNGNNTLTTVIAATVNDAVGNPVPNGTFVHFEVAFPTGGVVVGNGQTGVTPGSSDCNVSRFEQVTGVKIVNRAGVAYVCLTYPAGVAGSSRIIRGKAGPTQCVGGAHPFAACTNVGECDPAFYCSNSIATVCEPIKHGDTQCPPGGICEEHPASACEKTAISEDNLTLPLPHNDCSVNGQPCSDFNPCTTGDVCGGGLPDLACVGGSNNGLVCTSDVQCPDLRRCLYGTSDGSPCTGPAQCLGGGTCELQDPSSGCQITTPPTCQPGTLTMCPDDGNACTVDVCNFYTGQCGMPPECPNDQNPCTDDVCNPAGGTCGVQNTAPCEDGNPCTVSDICAAGICTAGPVIPCADDGNSCTIDQCNPGTGKCGIRLDPCACSAP